jgi:hypothetical protein
VIDLTIEPAHLEEAFLELYEDADLDRPPASVDGTTAAPIATEGPSS